jgi:DNA-binding transcriptional LysR family regulator
MRTASVYETIPTYNLNVHFMDPLNKLSWDWLKCFVLVAEHGSVASAAQFLETNPATVSRQISALEAHLGLELFVRSRQGMQVTLQAMQFLEPAQAMYASMQQLSLGVAAKDKALQGLVRISASVTLANFILPELLYALRQQHPGIQIEVIATDSQSNLTKREADIAIRLYQPTQNELIAKRVGYFPLGLYASASYLAKRGNPKLDPENLMRHDFIDVAPKNPLREGFTKSSMTMVCDRIVCITSDHASAWEMLKAGMGIGSGFSVVADRNPAVQAVLTDVVVGRFPVWLVTHKELRQQPRLRVVFDYLAHALKTLNPS